MTMLTRKLGDGAIGLSPPGREFEAMSPEEIDAFLQPGIDDADAGRLIPHEVIVADIRRRLRQPSDT